MEHPRFGEGSYNYMKDEQDERNAILRELFLVQESLTHLRSRLLGQHRVNVSDMVDTQERLNRALWRTVKLPGVQ